jgi:hypothetical protein
MFRHRLNKVVVVAAVTCGLAAAPAVALAASGPPVDHAVAACSPSGTVTWLNTTGQAATMSVIYDLQFTNLSGRSCRIYGYPGVSAVSLRGRQVGAAARRSKTTPEKVVTVAAGKTAEVLLQVFETGNFSRAKCRPVTAAGLRVYLPGRSVSRVVPFPFSACSGRSVTFLTVSPVVNPR